MRNFNLVNDGPRANLCTSVFPTQPVVLLICSIEQRLLCNCYRNAACESIDNILSVD